MYGRNRNARLLTGGIVGVPPGYGDEYWDDVSLLIRGDTLTDLSGNNTLTNNGATVDPGTYKFSTNGSLLFDGSNDYINAANTDLLDLAGGDWTIEAWVYLPDLSPNYQMISCAGGPTLAFNNTDGLAWQFYIRTTDIHFSYNTASSYATVTGTHNMSTSTWYHVAVSRNGSTFRLFVDGSQVASATGTPSAPSSIDRTFIGIGNNTVNDPYKGNIENFRITKGVARYTSNFTPPTANFLTNAPVVGRRGVGTEATLRTRGYIGVAPAGGGMLTLYDRYFDALIVKPDGLTAATAGDSAAQILADYPSSPDGIYYIKDGAGTKQVYCDMTNGGWMLYSSFASTNTLDATNYPAWNGNRILHTQLGTYGYAAIGAGILNYSDGVTNFPGTGYAHQSGYYGFYYYHATNAGQDGGVGATTWKGPSNVSELRIGWGQGSPSLTGTVYLDINGSQVTSMSSATPLVSTYSFDPAGASHYFGVREAGIGGISFVYMR